MDSPPTQQGFPQSKIANLKSKMDEHQHSILQDFRSVWQLSVSDAIAIDRKFLPPIDRALDSTLELSFNKELNQDQYL